MARLDDANCRLLTLIGPGGVGKTRLSIQVGQVLAHTPQRYKDGAYFIPLVAVTDEAMLVTVITQSLGIQLTEQMPPKQQLLTYLQNKSLLLVCDNFEQILSGAALLKRDRCPDATGATVDHLAAAAQFTCRMASNWLVVSIIVRAYHQKRCVFSSAARGRVCPPLSVARRGSDGRS